MASIDFSIIIPVYNGESFIERAIQSVLAQTYTNYEIIVVNDGSTDGTGDVLGRYGNIIKVIDQVNGGVSSARNAGLSHANGRYIAYLDADDQWEPCKLERYLTVFNEHQVDFIFSDLDRTVYGDYSGSRKNSDFFSFIDDFPRVCRVDDITIYTGKQLRNLLFYGYPFYPSTFAIARTKLEHVGWAEGVKYSEDLLFGLHCSDICSFAYIGQALTLLDCHETNASSDLINMYHNDVKAFEAYSSKTTGLNKYMGLQAASRKNLSLGLYYANQKELKRSLYHYGKSLISPTLLPYTIKGVMSSIVKSMSFGRTP